MLEQIKVKEGRILALEDENGVSYDENAQLMKDEIDYLKEIIRKQLDKEQTPYILGLQGEIEGLKAFKNQIVDKTADSANSGSGDLVAVLQSKIEDQLRVIEELNNYVSTKCSIESFMTLETKHNPRANICKGNLANPVAKHAIVG